jgi:AcrR family transcriptional regulator
MTKLINKNNSSQEPQSRRERAKADKQRRILEASKQLFASKGFDQTTVQQIADAADVAVGTLFLYVEDKSELFLMLFHEEIQKDLERATESLKASVKLIPAVSRFLLALMSYYEKDPELSRVFWREFLFHKGKARTALDELTHKILGALHDRILTAKIKGEISQAVDPEVAALHIYALYHSTLSFHLAECLPSKSSKETLESLLQSLWRGMEPPKEIPRRGGRSSDFQK